MRETVEIVRALLRGGEVTVEGKVIEHCGAGSLLFEPRTARHSHLFRHARRADHGSRRGALPMV